MRSPVTDGFPPRAPRGRDAPGPSVGRDDDFAVAVAEAVFGAVSRAMFELTAAESVSDGPGAEHLEAAIAELDGVVRTMRRTVQARLDPPTVVTASQRTA